MAEKTSIPKGTRDFSPIEVNRRNYIFNTIKNVYYKYGYQPIETPAMEYLSTLLGKYGEEGDRLLFRILNSGDFLSKINNEDLKNTNSQTLSNLICEKGLRYDLTVPFARYVVQYFNDLPIPFKRFQIQPVWRGDNPQKGRYREFYQCDADVVGSNSLLNEVELVQIIDEVFTQLKIDVIIKINNRKILEGIAEYIGEKENITNITVAIDKLEKIGIEGVTKELTLRGIKNEAIDKIKEIIEKIKTDNKLENIRKIISNSETGLKGIEEIETIFNYLKILNLKSKVDFDITLARGLNYYTGAIFEVKAADIEIGSICGGGRYDNLTGIFGLSGLSGVGISFGADRIYDVLNNLKLFPEDIVSSAKVMIANFGGNEENYALKLADKIRKIGISCELYPDNAKMKKQFAYANKKQIEFVIIAGEEEIKKGTLAVKNMKIGIQDEIKEEYISDYLINKLTKE
jgi:histidyl-tRNA synthetase